MTMDLLTQPIWRRFWYPVAFADEIGDGPVARTLLGERIVIWRTSPSSLAAAMDRCPHRDARLSQGWLCEDKIVCPYHGWEWSAAGAPAVIPQTPGLTTFPPKFTLDTLHCEVRSRVVWICLDEPIVDLPDVPDPDAGAGRFIREFDEVWSASPARLMENSFDPAHTVFVHRATFGDMQNPDIATPVIERTATGFVMHSDLSVANPKIAQASSGETDPMTIRSTSTILHSPFLRELRIAYPSGRVHQIVMAATPVDNNHLRLVQWAIRNDTESDSPAADVIAFDRRVTEEDRELLEGIEHPYSPELDSSVHIRVDRATIELRRVYLAMIAGEWPMSDRVAAPATPTTAAHSHELLSPQ